jgi:hypothetical protein
MNRLSGRVNPVLRPKKVLGRSAIRARDTLAPADLSRHSQEIATPLYGRTDCACQEPYPPNGLQIWRREVRDLTRPDERRPGVEGRFGAAMRDCFIGQVSTWVSVTLGL